MAAKANTSKKKDANESGPSDSQKRVVDDDAESLDGALQTNCFGTRKLSLARLRWRMLSRSLHEGPAFCAQPLSGSTRQFESFGLVKLMDEKLVEVAERDSRDADLKSPAANSNGPSAKENVNNNGSAVKSGRSGGGSDKGGKWYQCVCNEASGLRLEVRLLVEKLPLKEFLSCDADHTGIVCVWPSEEILAYYCLKNKELCCGKVICELGGGMTCLAGLVVAATCSANQVLLTDGNERSVANVNEIVQRNATRFGKAMVRARRLRWSHFEADGKDLEERVDVVLCSDCLYFDDGRAPLVETIWRLLQPSGVAVILAPRRGTTFQSFVDLCKTRGFLVEHVLIYDTLVWERHEHFTRTLPGVYQPDLHYPCMIVLRKCPQDVEGAQ